jgi:hypothetical protein
VHISKILLITGFRTLTSRIDQTRFPRKQPDRFGTLFNKSQTILHGAIQREQRLAGEFDSSTDEMSQFSGANTGLTRSEERRTLGHINSKQQTRRCPSFATFPTMRTVYCWKDLEETAHWGTMTAELKRVRCAWPSGGNYHSERTRLKYFDVRRLRLIFQRHSECTLKMHFSEIDSEYGYVWNYCPIFERGRQFQHWRPLEPCKEFSGLVQTERRITISYISFIPACSTDDAFRDSYSRYLCISSVYFQNLPITPQHMALLN